jgi:HD-like signal output (HDOD) protein/CheY-like chemotaxis protein
MLHLPSLLLVDGDLELAQKLASSLERAGLATTAVATGSEASDELGRTPFDLVLVELELPDMSALGLLRALRRGSIDVPFAGIGGEPDIEAIVQLMRHGAVDYLAKPLRVSAVEAAVDRAAQLARRAADMRTGQPFGAVASSMSSHSDGSIGTGSWPSSSVSMPSGGDHTTDPHGRPHPSAASLRDPRHAPIATPSTPRVQMAARRSAAPSHAASGRGHNPWVEEQEPIIKRISRRLREGDLELPAIAPIAGQLQEMMARPDVEPDDIVAMLGTDASVTAGVLRLANSGRYGTSRAVTDLHEAVVRLGNKRALTSAQQVVMATLYTIDAAPLTGMLPAMWRNTVVTANGACEIANLLCMEDCEAEFVSGMLHNVGELALVGILAEMPDRLIPGPAGLAPVAELLTFAHEDFGRAVLKRWGMPARFVRVAGAHHRCPAGPEDRVSVRRRKLVELAWSMAIETGFRYLPDQEPGDIAKLCNELGLVVAEVERVYENAKAW